MANSISLRVISRKDIFFGKIVNDMPVCADRQLVVGTAANINFSVFQDIQNFAFSA